MVSASGIPGGVPGLYSTLANHGDDDTGTVWFYLGGADSSILSNVCLFLPLCEAGPARSKEAPAPKPACLQQETPRLAGYWHLA